MSKPRQIPVGQRNIIGAKVVQIREAKHMKQKEVVALLQSKGMDISDTSMSRLEGQNRLVQDFEVPILADALGVSVEWLLSREE
jgi:transcriptional regulator with XRE-family HTH domain